MTITCDIRHLKQLLDMINMCKIANSPINVGFWIVICQIKGFWTPISTRVEPFLWDKNCGNCHHFSCFLLFLLALLFKMPYFLKFYQMKKSYAHVNDKLSDVIVWWQTSYMISHEKVWRVNAPLRAIWLIIMYISTLRRRRRQY